MMGLFGLTFEKRYPVYGFGADARNMTADEVLTMQGQLAWAAQQAYQRYDLGYLQGFANYEPFQQPLDERFADFKVRLAASIERRKLGH